MINFNKINLNLGYYTISNSIVLIYQLFYQYFIMKHLSIEEFSQYSIAMLISSYVIFFSGGLQTNLAVKSSRSGEYAMDLREINSSYTFFLILILLGFPASLVYIQLTGGNQAIQLAFLSMLFSIKALVIQKFFKILLRSSKQIKILSIYQILIVILLIPVSYFFIRFSLSGIFYINLIEVTLSLFLYFNALDYKLKLDCSKINQVVIDGFKYWKTNFLFLLFPIIVSSIGLYILGSNKYGIFAIYFIVLNLLSKFISSLEKLNYIEISKAFPDFSKIPPKKVFSESVSVFFYFLLISFIVFLFFGKDILMLTLPKYVQAYEIINFAFVSTIISLFNFLNVYFDASENISLKYYSGLSKIAFFLLFIFLFWVYSNLNMNSISISVVIAELFSLIVNIIVYKSFIKNYSHG